MLLPGRISAAIEILADFDQRRIPLKNAIADWGRNNRYAGAKDRAWISGLCLDALRRRHSLAQVMGDESARAIVLATLIYLWRKPIEEIENALTQEHGAGALSETEKAALSNGDSLPDSRDFPAWMDPHIERVFGENASLEMTAFASRADIDLRINTLKTTPEKAFGALKAVKGRAVNGIKTAARIDAPDPSEKAPAVNVIPAFNKGWVEVQDLGSQIAASAAGSIKGSQVLDYCAGGGGKTLALAALMENSGQLYAYDRDPRRLKPLYARAKRAGLRNLHVINPYTDKEHLEAIVDKMDVVFVDAPCTGAGTWRRHPDTKWRLTEKQLSTRMAEQDAVLKQADVYVKPGGRLIYVTCSFLMEENEDRLTTFLDEHPSYRPIDCVSAMTQSGLIDDDAIERLTACQTPSGAIRLTPHRMSVDGFFVSVLSKESNDGSA